MSEPNDPKVFRLVPRLPADDPSRARVIEAMERMLARAKAGGAISFAAAVTFPDGSVGTLFETAADASLFALLGGVDYLRHRVTEEIEDPKPG